MMDAKFVRGVIVGACMLAGLACGIDSAGTWEDDGGHDDAGTAGDGAADVRDDARGDDGRTDDAPREDADAPDTAVDADVEAEADVGAEADGVGEDAGIDTDGTAEDGVAAEDGGADEADEDADADAADADDGAVEDAPPPCGGVRVGGYCWYPSAPDGSCTDACTAHGGCSLAGTRDFAGSGGTDANCVAVLAALGYGGYPHQDWSNNNLGCHFAWASWTYWSTAAVTTCEAAAPGAADAVRMCACNG